MTDEINLLNECQTSFIGLFRSLCDLHVGLETGVYSAELCQDKLQKLKENHQKLIEKFEVCFQNCQNIQILKLKTMLSLSQTCLTNTKADVVSIKFASIQILDILRNQF